SELVAEVAACRISAAHVVDSYAVTIEQVDREIEAWEAIDVEGARRAAESLDGMVRAGRSDLPLLGVPIGVKDVIRTEALPTSFGCPAGSLRGPRSDAAVIAQLRRAGAVVIGKTVTCTFAGPDPARTRNPWDLARTPGGSSAGSAAAVAAGTVPIAIGTQT